MVLNSNLYLNMRVKYAELVMEPRLCSTLIMPMRFKIDRNKE